jgi:hypothetical protein
MGWAGCRVAAVQFVDWFAKGFPATLSARVSIPQGEHSNQGKIS